MRAGADDAGAVSTGVGPPGRIASVGRRLSTLPAHPVLGPAAVLSGVGMCCAAIWFGDPTTPGGVLPACPTKFFLGITCPGCGMQRAIYSLLHGDLAAALHYNAVGVIALALLLVSFGTYCLRLWTGRRICGWHNLRWSAVAVLLVVIAWFVVRNIPVQPFWSLHV